MKKTILVYLSLSNFAFEAVDAGRIDCLLVQLAPPFYNSIRNKCLLLSRLHRTYTNIQLYSPLLVEKSKSIKNQTNNNLREWSLVPLLLSSKWNSSSGLILLNPLQILNTSIKFCLFLLSSNDHKFNFCNLSSCALPFISFIIFVNLRWTFSNSSLSFL